ncbi:branched-chain amino acid ABC transporter permease [Herbaspirillum sp. GCM10030257]|uniref:branched-chain amino acid ABC transporter permease n=1 Tax=Herbaspirillum sp. GCM10030257 TaxID=3273393 RepID=UPI00360C21D1
MMQSKSSAAAVGGVLVLLLSAPLVLSPGLLNAAVQVLVAALFASAYNLLCGQAGMLSFGHAAYFGIGAFATMHAMKAVGGAGLLPTPLLPLAGAAAGLVIGAAAGWFATKRSGTYFAMITLAIAELLHALAPHLKGWFGGEAGVSGMRMPAWGFSFGSTMQMYYLTLSWVLAGLALLYFFTRTPVGRLALGLRENAHRLAFLGYDVHRVSVLVFTVSAMFSGIAGGLLAVNNEAVNYVLFDAHVSASAVLNAYIGGVKVFFGPVLGAGVMTFFGYAVSDLTQSWLLYQGILFVLVMMFMPDGLAGLLVRWWEWQSRLGLRSVLPVSLAGLAAALLLGGGTVFLVELLQRLFSQDYRAAAGVGQAIVLFGLRWLPREAVTWLAPTAALAAGLAIGVMALRQARLLTEANTDAPSSTEVPLQGARSTV